MADRYDLSRVSQYARDVVFRSVMDLADCALPAHVKPAIDQARAEARIPLRTRAEVDADIATTVRGAMRIPAGDLPVMSLMAFCAEPTAEPEPEPKADRLALLEEIADGVVDMLDGEPSGSDSLDWALERYGYKPTKGVPAELVSIDGKICVVCGQQVEPERECYAVPHCLQCLPAPEPLPIRTVPPGRPSFAIEWQCSSCGWGFFGPLQEDCPACGAAHFWTGSVSPDAKPWPGYPCAPAPGVAAKPLPEVELLVLRERVTELQKGVGFLQDQLIAAHSARRQRMTAIYHLTLNYGGDPESALKAIREVSGPGA